MDPMSRTFIITLPVKEEEIESETQIEVRLDIDNRLVTEIKVQFNVIILF